MSKDTEGARGVAALCHKVKTSEIFGICIQMNPYQYEINSFNTRGVHIVVPQKTS